MNNLCPRCGYDSDTLSLAQVQPPPDAIIAISQTNSVPSPGIAETCRNSIPDVEAHISKLDEIIERHEDTLRHLQEERSRLSGFTQTYKQVIHPVRRLPVEVLADIFLTCADKPNASRRHITYHTPCDYNSLVETRSWWRLSQISRQWRKITLSHAKIWSYVGVDLPETGNFDSDLLAARLILQLQRSQSEPLTIALRSMSRFSRNDYHSVIVALCAHSSRWENLRLEFGRSSISILRLMSRLVRRNVTMLSRLHLELSQCTPDPMSGTLDAFAIAPQLVHLTLLGPTIFTASELLCLPWSQITHFRGSSMSMLTEAANNYEFLHKMSSLKAFMDHRSFAADWNGLAAIDVPSLEVLSLFSLNRTASNISLLLDHLNAVHLRDLRISTNPHTESLLRFTRRSAASLRSMTLALRDSDVSKTIELLECVPDLHTLLIYEGSFELIRCLGDYDPQRQAPRLLPKLHTLRIFGSQISHRAHEALLLEIAESRVAPAPDLSSSITQTNTGSNYLCVLELDVNIGIRQEALDALGMYHSRGLKTHLSHAKYFFQFN